MYPDEQQEVFAINNFQGFNQSIAEQLLEPIYTQNAQNFMVEDGNLTVVKGNTEYIHVNVTPGFKTIMAFYKQTPLGETESYLLGVNEYGIHVYDEDNIFLWPDVTPPDTTINNPYFSFLNYQIGTKDIIIMSNGIQPMYKWDGKTFELLGPGTPRCSSISLHYERLWATGDVKQPNRVYFSDDLDPANWKLAENEGGFIDFPTWDGGVCIGLSAIFDNIVVFKTYNIWKIHGTNPGEYGEQQVFSSTGAIAPKSIQDAGRACLFLARDGIHSYDGMETQLISKPIDKIIKSMNLEYADKAVAAIYNNKYVLAIPLDSSTENNCVIEYDLSRNTFIIKKGFNAISFLPFDNKLIFTAGDGNIYEYDKGDSFGHMPIVAYWETPYSNLGAPDVNKRSSHIYMTLEKIYGSQMQVEGLFDKKSKTARVILPDTKADKKVRLRCQGRHFKLRFSNVNGSRFTLSMPRLHYDADKD